MKSGKLFIVTGPSGSGKSTIVDNAIKRLVPKTKIERVITFTCRHPRKGEVNGKDYFFISPDDFKIKSTNGFFLETSTYCDHPYGSPSSIKEDLVLGKSLIMVTDRDGAKKIKQLVPESILVWVKTEDIKTLEKRLISRNTDSIAQIEKRIEIAKEESKHEESQPACQYHLVNNDHEFDRSVGELMLIIQEELSGV